MIRVTAIACVGGLRSTRVADHAIGGAAVFLIQLVQSFESSPTLGL